MTVAALAGIVVHLVLSGIFGLIASSSRLVQPSSLSLVSAAAIVGLLLWIVNFYLIAPVAFHWFGMANPYVPFVSHPTPFSMVRRSDYCSQRDGR